MKKRYPLLLSVILTIALSSCQDSMMKDIGESNKKDNLEENSSSLRSTMTNAKFYWYKGKKVLLYPDAQKEYILYKASDEDKLFQNIKSSTSGLKIGEISKQTRLIHTPLNSSIANDALKWAIIPKEASMSTKNEILYRGDFFTDENGKSVGLSHLFYVKLKAEKDFEKLKKYADKYGLWIVSQNEYMPQWYTLACIKTELSSIELANLFHETGEFEIAQPDIIVDDELICADPNDPLFPLQWGLKNTGQGGGIRGFDIAFNEAYEITQGSSSVVVAVIDHGIDLSHTDLNIHPISYDTETATSPSVIRGPHGTACAGIIGAKTNNGTGVAGIAPLSPLMSISNNLRFSPNISEKLADGFNFAWRNGASVISNSWGGLAPSSILDDAIEAALRYGRRGKGCVVAFSSGNGDSPSVLYPASSNPDILAVGAMSPCGERKSRSSCDGDGRWGSNYGSTLDIVAPGVKIPTTDWVGRPGYSSGDYYNLFGGTSSACPHVAAVAALILSVKPELTQQEVCRAILRSARKLPIYTFREQKEYGLWNNEVGYGLVNANAALQSVMGADIVYFNDQVVSFNREIYGNIILSRNVLVRNSAKLLFAAQQKIVLTPPFEIERGSQFEMRF
ncbi:S8 family peptidase [Porphyromonas cangingivalis]|uniref:S8 family peptidase n=1 Tax=Porphyromonas cangingivalis TaxID=36874 RepID=UPI00242A91D2|nr:S8 family serine peptidase [Porphyromonas cangingivalis]